MTFARMCGRWELWPLNWPMENHLTLTFTQCELSSKSPEVHHLMSRILKNGHQPSLILLDSKLLCLIAVSFYKKKVTINKRLILIGDEI
jgi:hypothetical protein